MVYARKSKRTMRKRTRKITRRFNITRKKASYPRSGFLKTVRCSNLQTTYNCHKVWFGDDTINFVDDTAQFRLSDLPNYTELTALFDNYRIVKVLYRWVLFRNPNSDKISIDNRGVYPNLMWVHDFNDSSAIGRAQLMTHAGMRELYLNEQRPATRWYTLNPSTLSTTYETGLGAPAYNPRWRQWLDTNDINTLHYGLKLCLNNIASFVGVKLETKYVLEFKGVS